MKRFRLILLFLFLLLSTLKAQITKRNLLRQFSEQMVTESLIPKGNWKPFPNTPTEWKAACNDSTLASLIKAGEAALKESFPSIPATVALEYERTGSRINYQNIGNRKRMLLWDLSLAESIEGNGRFSDHLADGIWSVCEETFWGTTAHLYLQKGNQGLPDAEHPVVDLFVAETASELAWINYLVGSALDKVSPLIRERIKYETERRLFKPLENVNYFYLGNGDTTAILNNWTPWIMSNYIAVDLLLQENEQKRVSRLLFGMKYIDQYINGLGEDGGCDEGPAYWFHATGTVFDALCLLDNATQGKVNIYKDPFLLKMGAYIYKAHVAGDYFINVADAAPKLWVNGLLLYRFGKATGDTTMTDFGSWAYHTFPHESPGGPISIYCKSRYLFNLFAMDECTHYPSNFKDVDDSWFSDIQLMSSRSANGFFLATHAGHNGNFVSHHHNDVGDFIIYSNGYPVIIDAGPGLYTSRTFTATRYKLWFNSSAFHNLPTINGYQQSDGSSFMATKVKYRLDKYGSSLGMDIANAYPAAAGVQSWERQINISKTGSIEINDNYKLATPLKELTQTFMTICKTDISQPGKLIFLLPGNEKVYLEYDAKTWDIKKEKIPLITEEDKSFMTMWEGKDIWRLLLVSKIYKRTDSIFYKIHR